MNPLINQPTPHPTRKVTSSTAAAALAGAVVAAIAGVVPMDEATRSAVQVIVDGAIGAGLTALVTFVAGYFTRERARSG